MSCTKIGEFCKRPAEKTLLRIPISGSAFIKTYLPNEILGLGDVRRPRKQNGFEYIVTAAGQCDLGEPEWPVTIGATVTWGAVTFACQAISNASLARVVQSCLWSSTGAVTVSDDGIVNTSGEQEVFGYANGGVQGETGDVIARITFSDSSVEDALLSYHVD